MAGEHKRAWLSLVPTSSVPTELSFEEHVKRFARGEDAAYEMAGHFSKADAPYEGLVLDLFLELEEWESSAQAARAGHAARATELARAIVGY